MNRTRGGYLISKIHQVTGRIFAKLLKEAEIEDINPAQGRILFALWKKDKVPITELAKETLLHKSTLTKMLDRLEQMGYLKRRPSQKDRRKILIYRTVKDRALESKYAKVSEEMTRIFYEGFTSDRIDRFERDLEQILENLIRYEADLK